MTEAIINGIWGLIVGDALGVPVEFSSRASLDQRPVTAMRAYGTHYQPAGTWSDDSSLTLCLVESLIEGLGLPRLGEKFIAWRDEGHWTPHGELFDIGISTDQAIDRLEEGRSPRESGGVDEYSNGNGSLMRILPLALETRLIPELAQRYQLVKEVSAITHAHPRSCLACFYYLELATELACGLRESFDSAYRKANESLERLMELHNELIIERPAFESLLTGQLRQKDRDEITSSGYVMDTLEASLWCLLNSSSYQEAVLMAVNLGDDTDTTAAVCGGLAGIHYGGQAIPSEWRQHIVRKHEIDRLLKRLNQRYT